MSGWMLLLAVVLSGAAACGDDGSGAELDAGTPGNHSLEVLDPPGRSIGLQPNQPVLLRVRYLDPAGAPAPGAAVGFAIEGDGNGATLADVQAYTGADGVAAMLLTAGGEASSFLVRVSAPDAVGVSFEVAVSPAGFADLQVRPTYQGSHPLSRFESVKAQLFLDRSCPPAVSTDLGTPDRSRQASGFGEDFAFENLPVGHDVVVVVQGTSGAGRLLAWGCASVAESQLVAGTTAVLGVLLADVRISSQGTYALQTTLVLPESHAADWMAAVAPLSQVARCDHGLEQALLDCVADAAYPDGTVDCVVTASDASVLAFESTRGVLDGAGCRGPVTQGGDPSVEALLAESEDATGVAVRQALSEVEALDPLALATLQVRSTLTLAEATPTGDVFAWHALSAVRFPLLAPDLDLDLAQQGNGVLGVDSLPAAYVEGDPPVLLLPVHEMSLHPAWCVWSFVRATVLEPAGLPAHPTSLLATWIAAHRMGATWVGLAAVQAVVCDRLGLSESCLGASWSEGLTRLEDRLAAPWQTIAPPSSADLAWTAQVALPDADGDRVADGLGSATHPFQWLASIRLGDDQVAPTEAECTATRQ